MSEKSPVTQEATNSICIEIIENSSQQRDPMRLVYAHDVKLLTHLTPQFITIHYLIQVSVSDKLVSNSNQFCIKSIFLFLSVSK